MRFDRFIQALLPHESKFFSYFEQATENLVQASRLLLTLPGASAADRPRIVQQIHDAEHRGDSITHEIFSELNRTFITPFDREDIHRLASAVDDILDYLDGSATRFVLYKVGECPPELVCLIKILDHSIDWLHRGIGLVRNLRESGQLQLVLQKVNEYENEADAVFENAIAKLFDEEKDPVRIIKLKEIYVGLETATDKCEDAANVLEALLIKQA
jgi:predicted phosphate transport protein (TIGR00153 family)